MLADTEWDREWVIHREKVTLNIAETAIIDKSDFVYRKYWGLCFIPGAVQYYNFKPLKGTAMLVITGLSIAGSVTSYLLMESDLDNVPARNMYKTAFWGGITIASCVYIYSCIDGIITMRHLYELFYPD